MLRKYMLRKYKQYKLAETKDYLPFYKLQKFWSIPTKVLVDELIIVLDTP